LAHALLCPSDVQRAQALLRGCALPLPEARSLLAYSLGVRREHLIAHPEEPVDEQTRADFERLVADRQRSMPMAYLLGVQEFYGHGLCVSPEVLVPRPETEVLVQTGLQLLCGRAQARVLELGTGSGCIAVALALARPDLWIVATDRSKAALRVARKNCARLGATVQLVAGNWYAPIQGRFDLIVSNPPYVSVADPHLAQLRFEPRAALTDEDDGLSALRTVIAGAPTRLAAGGHLLVEHGYDQGAAVRGIMRQHGLARVVTLRDLSGQERAGLGQRAR